MTPHFWHGRPICALTVAFAGCLDPTLDGDSDRTPAPTPRPIIEVTSDHPTDPRPSDFGQIYVGDARTKELIARNVGTATLQIRDMALPPDAENFGAPNAVVFDRDHLPENGDGLEVEYTPLGDCSDG